MLKQIRKDVARKLYNLGTEIQALPCNMCVGNAWMSPFHISNKCDVAFDDVVNAIEYYNCNAETGRYLRYYLKTS